MPHFRFTLGKTSTYGDYGYGIAGLVIEEVATQNLPIICTAPFVTTGNEQHQLWLDG